MKTLLNPRTIKKKDCHQMVKQPLKLSHQVISESGEKLLYNI